MFDCLQELYNVERRIASERLEVLSTPMSSHLHFPPLSQDQRPFAHFRAHMRGMHGSESLRRTSQ